MGFDRRGQARRVRCARINRYPPTKYKNVEQRRPSRCAQTVAGRVLTKLQEIHNIYYLIKFFYGSPR